MKKKKVAKIVVNSLTLSRIAGTICLPFIFNLCSAPIFILFVASILFTDFLDGALARKFDVSTIFGSLADMTADKILGIALLGTLATIYPVMTIPLIFEASIAGVNINSLKNDSAAKSSQIGRIKMWVVGLSICSLFIVGLTPELTKELNNINVTDINNTFSNLFNNIGKNIDNIINQLKTLLTSNQVSFKGKNFEQILYNTGSNLDNTINNLKSGLQDVGLSSLKFVENNKEPIKITAELSTLLSELYVLKDYMLKNIKNKVTTKSNKEIIKELKDNKEFIKSIMFDEEYYKKTKDDSLIKKLTKNIDKK